MCHRGGMRVTGVDACRRGWVAVSLDVAGPGAARLAAVRVHQSLAGVLEAGQGSGVLEAGRGDRAAVVGIDMPLGLLESGWRKADLAARGLLGPRRSSVFAIPPRAVWMQPGYEAANQRCRELTGRGFSIQAWGLRAKLLEADRYRGTCGHPLYEVHPELAFAAMAGAPLAHSKHTAAGRDLRRELLSQVGIAVPLVSPAPVTDTLDAAAVAWSAWRIATGRAAVVPAYPQRDSLGREIAIRY
jgi:predicted RNase H-like nuclease